MLQIDTTGDGAWSGRAADLLEDLQRWADSLSGGVALSVTLEVRSRPDEDPLVHVDHLWIEEASRSQGWGSRILTELVSSARLRNVALSVTPAELDDDTDLPRLVRFYERHGFRTSEMMLLPT